MERAVSSSFAGTLLLLLVFVANTPSCQSNLVQTLTHALHPGDQFVTDPEKWTIDDDFRCILVNGSFAIIEDHELCNGNISCENGDDESDTICHSLERCSAGKIKCPMERVCLTTAQLCDGISDCTQDAWDERETAGCLTAINSTATQLECPAGLFACAANVKCLGPDALCNYKWDCDDGSDESASTCPSGQTCPEGMFHCYKTQPDDTQFFHHCAMFDEVCNQIGDCPNSEDEMPDLSPCTLHDLFKKRPGHHGGSEQFNEHHHPAKNVEVGNQMSTLTKTPRPYSNSSQQPRSSQHHSANKTQSPRQHKSSPAPYYTQKMVQPSLSQVDVRTNRPTPAPRRSNSAAGGSASSQFFVIAAPVALILASIALP